MGKSGHFKAGHGGGKPGGKFAFKKSSQVKPHTATGSQNKQPYQKKPVSGDRKQPQAAGVTGVTSITSVANTGSGSGSGSKSVAGKALSAMQAKFAKKLEGGRFRYINEKLYKSTGKEAFEEFQQDPDLFTVYHTGYREQVLSWPENPLDKIIKWIKDNHRAAVIADMGCGEARLSASVPNKVHSFDLVSTKPEVVACNIAHTPLRDASVDIVVFCLSLMGTTISDFVKEAHRILKAEGIVKIIEVRSRFESEEHGVKKFLKVLKKAGFDIIFQPTKANTMFFEVECKKTDRAPDFDTSYSVKPCVYKKR